MKKKINITIILDENNIPEYIYWTSNNGLKQKTKSLMLSIWDEIKQEVIKIDVWTKTMKLDDMKLLCYQLLLSLSETYIKATLDYKGGKTIQQFAIKFAKDTKILP